MDIILTPKKHFARLRHAAPAARMVSTLDELQGGNRLICFSTGVIVPQDILSSFTYAYNFHGASPQYPGRDPHHWAAYERSRTFGAVAHIMHSRVDAGPIVGALTFGMPDNSPPSAYRERASQALYSLYDALAPMMLSDSITSNGMVWSGTKRSRADLVKLCDMTGAPESDVADRKFALQGFEPLFVE